MWSAELPTPKTGKSGDFEKQPRKTGRLGSQTGRFPNYALNEIKMVFIYSNSFTRFGAKVWNCFPSQMYKLNKPVFKRKIREALFAVLDIEDNYVEAPILLLKMNRHLK